jgi:hypothetical protein
MFMRTHATVCCTDAHTVSLLFFFSLVLIIASSGYQADGLLVKAGPSWLDRLEHSAAKH